MHCSDLTALKT